MSERGTIERVGVVGAGTMGNGIAHVCSMAGLDVLMVDVDAGALEGARGTIERNLQRQVKKEKISAGDAEGALARIRTTTDPAGLSDAQLVVEAVPEKAELKHDIFAKARRGERARDDPGHEHELHLDHGDRLGSGEPGARHRHALHEPRARS